MLNTMSRSGVSTRSSFSGRNAAQTSSVATTRRGRVNVQQVSAIKDGATLDRPLRVAVIGGGPSGACAADTLAQGGVQAFMFERKMDNCKPCGGAIPICMVEEFDLPMEIIDRKVTKMKMISPSNREVDVGKTLSETEWIGMCRREVMDDFLRKRAEKSGAQVINGLMMRMEQPDPEGPITIFYNNYAAGGKVGVAESVVVDVVIGADGANSRVAKEIDAGEYDYAIAFQERIRIPDDKMKYYEDLAEMYVGDDVSPDFYGWVFPKYDHVAVGTGTVVNKTAIKQYQQATRDRAQVGPLINGGSGGKIIREFAILLDPLKNAPVAATTSPRRAPARPSRTSGPSPAQTRHVGATPRAEAPAANAGKGEYGPVKSGDTLSSIARESRLSGVSMNQMLVALKQANPDAFYRDNINTLKRGAILRIPTASEAQSLAVIAAIAEVHRQNSDWRSGTIGKPTTVADSATRATASSAPTAKGRADADRLALVSTTEQKGASGPGGNKVLL
ncbi:MAG: hypothetical protein WDW38_005802 [Sanguina aurantia]